MYKYSVIGLLLAFVLGTVGTAQENATATEERVSDVQERILIDDPAPVETEYFLAQGAAPAEIVDEADLETDASALAALSEEADGDMAAMPEVFEE